jgi:phosphoglycerate dehydrogenase-like enzyme
MTSTTSILGDSDHLLIVDLMARAPIWALRPEGERVIAAAVPTGWRMQIVRSPTSSDGDGAKQPSDEVVQAIASAEVYFGFGFPRALFLAGKRLKWVHTATAGVGSLLYPEMLSSDLILTNSAGIHAQPIADYVLAGVMHFLRGLDVAQDQQRRCVWSKSFYVSADSPVAEVADSRVLIIGAGGIGAEVARRFTAVGATCVGVRRRPELGAPAGFARVVGHAAIDAELESANVVVVAAPMTAITRGVLTAERLDLLPPDAIVVNVSRGGLIDEEALAARLAGGRLRGAVLDVFQNEPLAPSSPLWQLRSVLITPHISSVSPAHFWPRQIAVFVDNWHRYVRGEKLRNQVDKQVGY